MMKKLFYAIASLIMLAGLTSCDMEIKNVSINKLVGTWDLVSDTVVYKDGTSTTTTSNGSESMIIGENTITIVAGSTQNEYSFSYQDPHFIIDGISLYDLESLTRNEMVLSSNLTLGILLTDRKYTYKRR